MKRMIALLLVLAAVMTVAVGCKQQATEPETTTANTTVESATQDTQKQDENMPQSALSLLENTWALFGDDEKFFVAGGDENNAVSDAPGVYDVANKDGLMFGLLVPEGQVASVAEAANLMHAMNSNVFSAAAFRLVEGTDANTFATDIRNAVQNNQWMCGIPDGLFVALIGDEYVVIAYGQEPLYTFEAKLAEAYPEAEILYKELLN